MPSWRQYQRPSRRYSLVSTAHSTVGCHSVATSHETKGLLTNSGSTVKENGAVVSDEVA